MKWPWYVQGKGDKVLFVLLISSGVLAVGLLIVAGVLSITLGEPLNCTFGGFIGTFRCR